MTYLNNIDEFNRLFQQYLGIAIRGNRLNWFVSDDSGIDYWRDKLEKSLNCHRELYQHAIDGFNSFVGPRMCFNEFVHKTHKQLLNMMDRKLREKFEIHANKFDHARIKSISNNGALSWLNVMYNFAIPRVLSNQQTFIALSLVAGLPIVTQDQIQCQKCGIVMDKMGYHCLHCVKSGYLFIRHDRICDVLFEYMKKAGFDVQKEARYHDTGKGKVRILRRPGDILVNDWKFDDGHTGKMYFDITVGNIFCDTYINGAARKRLYVAELRQKEKDKDYNQDDINGLGLECLGGMSLRFKGILQTMAGALEERTDICRSIWMNIMRSKIMMELMFFNTRMVQACYNLCNMDDLEFIEYS